MARFKKGGLMGGVSSEGFDESKHPRDSDGKFTSGGGGLFKKEQSITGAQNSESELTPPKESVKLAIDSPSARELHERISRGDYLSLEEIANNSVLSEMDERVDYYKSKYGITADIQTPERNRLQQEVKQQFLSQGSYTGRGNNKRPLFNGKIKREHKAVIAIGLPASGKSTMVEPLSRDMGAFVFDNDEIKALLPEYKETGGGAAGIVHDESKLIQEQAFQEFLSGSRKGDNLVIPTIGSDLKRLQVNFIDKLENAGYDVEVRFVDVSPIISANRVIKRAIEQGRVIKRKIVLEYGDKPRETFQALQGMIGKGGKPYVR